MNITFEQCACGHEKDWWLDCWNCGGDGDAYHDCGEDCCNCLHPEPNVCCDICLGQGGYYVCPLCADTSDDR